MSRRWVRVCVRVRARARVRLRVEAKVGVRDKARLAVHAPNA